MSFVLRQDCYVRLGHVFAGLAELAITRYALRLTPHDYIPSSTIARTPENKAHLPYVFSFSFHKSAAPMVVRIIMPILVIG